MTRRKSNAAKRLRVDTADIAIVGGGLAGALIAYRLRQERPDLRLVVFEQGATLGGNHTWSFHETDIAPAARRRLEPLRVHHWQGQSVAFPSHRRDLSTPYGAIESNRLHAVVAPVLGESLRLRATVEALGPDHVRLAGGERVGAHAVIDARGELRSRRLSLGFQKFIGQVVVFSKPHGLAAPVIMDATVRQEDGYRFVYVLPFSETTALVEDTRYADGETLDRDALRAGIGAYCAAKNWDIVSMLREEEGVLPIALAGDIDAFLSETPEGVAPVGMRAGLFHPLTGYSLPDAVALADKIAATRDLSGPSLSQLTRDHARERWRARSFYRLLSRMLYGAAAPSKRYAILERFYRLPQPLIERFYAGRTSPADQARILIGKPPVPIGRAFDCLDEARWMARAYQSQRFWAAPLSAGR